MQIEVETLVEENDGHTPLGKAEVIDTDKLPLTLLYTKTPFANGGIQGFVSVTLRKKNG